MPRLVYVRALARGVTLPDPSTPLQIVEGELRMIAGSPIPPRAVMAEVLAAGRSMHEPAEWEAFHPTPRELDAIEGALEARGFRRVSPPGSVETARQWIGWAHALHFGAAPARYVELGERDHALSDEIREALAAGDEARAHRLHADRLAVGRELVQSLAHSETDGPPRNPHH